MELAKELRSSMKQTNERNENSNKLLLEAIQKLRNNNNQSERPNSLRDCHSNHEENEPSSQSSVPRDTFLSFIPKGEPVVEEETTTNTVEEIAQMYANLDPNTQRLISFEEYYKTKIIEDKKKNHLDEDLEEKINEVKLPCYDGPGEEIAQSCMQKLDTYLS